MANKKISQLDSRASLSLSDLMAVGDPTTGYLYKTTISDLKPLTGAGVVSFNGRFGSVVPAEGDYTLTQLGDVIITSASNGQVLKYNGSNWVNAAEAAETDTLDSVTTRGNTTGNSITVLNLSATGLIVSSGAIYTNVGFYSNNNGNLRYTFDGNNLVLKAGTSTSNDYMTVFGATGNVAIGTVTDAGYKLDVNGSVRVGVDGLIGTNGSGNAPLIKFTTSNLVNLDPQGFGVITNSNLTVGGQISNNGFVTSTNYHMVKGGSTAVDTPFITYGIGRPDANYSLQALAGMGGYFAGAAWYNGAGLTFYTSIGTDITGGANLAEVMRITPAGVLSVANLAGTGSRVLVADADGVVSASTSALSGFVPYTGATTNVELGNNILSVSGQTTTAYLYVQSAGASMQYGQSIIKMIDHQNGGSLSLLLRPTGLTTGNNPIILFPAASGTVALTSDIPSLTNYVTLNGTQTISGAKTFSAIPVIDNGSSGMGLRFKMHASSSFGLNGFMDIAPVNNTGIVAFAFGVSSSATKLAYISAAGLTDNTARTFTLPDASGTLALTSQLTGGTVTSVGLTSATSGVFIGTTPITTSGTLSFTIGTASTSANGLLSSTDWNTFNGKQAALSGTGFVKISGTTISYDNSTYLTTASAASTYLALSGGTLTGALNVNLASGTGLNVASENVVFRAGTAFGSPRQIVLSMGSGPTTYLEAKGYGANYITDFGIRTYNSSGTAYEVFFATSAGDVGINTTSPAAKLDVNGTFKAVDAATFLSTATFGGNVFFNQWYGATGGNLNISTNTGGAADIIFGTGVGAGTERMRISSSGVKFQNGASYLNYYEEGSWTPTLRGAGSNGSYTLSNLQATYTRVGNIVTIYCSFSVVVNSAGSAYGVIGGLPFNITANSGLSCTPFLVNYTFSNSSAKYISILSPTSSSGSQLYMAEITNGGASTDSLVTGFTTGTIMQFCLTYRI